MFKKILIANRGEIAIRILRACKEMEIKTVAVHSVIDEALMHVKLADESVCIGSNRPADSYLNVSSILSAAELTGADAIHPGVGFLSENEKFAEIVLKHGLQFIGPHPKHIAMMGNKIIAKKTMEKLGIPVIQGSDDTIDDINSAKRMAEKFGYPILFKATNGGGGKGMKIANTSEEIDQAFKTARSEAKANFGYENVYIEKYLKNPRHIEIQIISDSFGNVLCLGERDCSIQRNHQKLWEESPSIVLSSKKREEICELVRKVIKKIGYIGVGTLEFLYEDDNFYFMEMNTRLQVEHSVSEEVTGVDIVQEQIRVAAGEKLSIKQSDIKLCGHAIEFRINAENPETFMPRPGKIEELYFPGGNGIRVDSHIYWNYVIPPYYDSLLAKVIVHAKTREACLAKARRAFSEIVIDGNGIQTTIDFHIKLLKNQDIINGNFYIHWVEDNLWKL
ncbi:MAG: acetyl-CoA carboxylase biotin carboxylase subunit [Holosporales bacterium]|jgi:acetyl-CoA carboxylase biotin carboxylase subunit|nr:acetyl-CoA carboxylase biotin carboxylase subunit [Holosporales bacterium]